MTALVNDASRAFSAAQQGDWDRAEQIIRGMSDDDLDALDRVTSRLVHPVTTEQAVRRLTRFIGGPVLGDCVPTASPAAAPPQ